MGGVFDLPTQVAITNVVVPALHVSEWIARLFCTCLLLHLRSCKHEVTIQRTIDNVDYAVYNTY